MHRVTVNPLRSHRFRESDVPARPTVDGAGAAGLRPARAAGADREEGPREGAPARAHVAVLRHHPARLRQRAHDHHRERVEDRGREEVPADELCPASAELVTLRPVQCVTSKRLFLYLTT